MNDEQRKRLAGKSGDNNSSRPPKYVVPLIRFDGNKGTFRKVSKNENNEDIEIELKAPIEFVILKKRRTLSSFSTNQSFFTNEHNNVNDKIMLFKVVSGAVTLEDMGFTAELRQKYQTIKTHEIIYVLFDGEVCKMEIKGGSLGGYYDYQKSLTAEELHSFEVVTIIGSEKAKSEGGFSFYKLNFDHRTCDEGTNFDLIEQKIDEVAKACDESDAFTAKKLSEKFPNRVSGNLTVEEGERIKNMREKAEKNFDNFGGKEEINADDIPF